MIRRSYALGILLLLLAVPVILAPVATFPLAPAYAVEP